MKYILLGLALSVTFAMVMMQYSIDQEAKYQQLLKETSSWFGVGMKKPIDTCTANYSPSYQMQVLSYNQTNTSLSCKIFYQSMTMNNIQQHDLLLVYKQTCDAMFGEFSINESTQSLECKIYYDWMNNIETTQPTTIYYNSTSQQ